MDCYHDPTLHPYKDFISIPSKLFELHAYRQNVRKNGPSLAKVKTFLALYISFSKVTPTPIQHSLCVCQSSVRSILLWHCGPEEFPSRLITVTNNLSMGRGKKNIYGNLLVPITHRVEHRILLFWSCNTESRLVNVMHLQQNCKRAFLVFARSRHKVTEDIKDKQECY